MYKVCTLGWGKNPNFCDPTRPELSTFFGFFDLKKPEFTALTRPDPDPNFRFGYFSDTRPKNPIFCQP